MVGIDYGQDTNEVIAVINQTLQNIKEVETEPTPDIDTLIMRELPTQIVINEVN